MSHVARLGVRVIPPNDIALTVIHNRSMTTGASSRKHGQEGENCSHRADDHQDDADRMDVESVLVGADGHRKIKNCSYRECNDAGYKSTSHSHSSFGSNCLEIKICY